MTEPIPDATSPHGDSFPGPPTLRRPIHGRMVAGVAAAVARYFDVDPVLVRIALVVLTFFGGSGLMLYLAGWLLIPEETAECSIGEHWLDHLTGQMS